MEVKTYIILNRDEINRKIPYSVVCEARYGIRWGTGKRKRKWLEEFTPAERKHTSELFNQAHRWTLTTGAPETIRMTPATFALWHKLAAFCSTI